MHRSSDTPRLTLLAGSLCLLLGLLMPGRADASGWPSKPSGIRVAAISHTSFTVTLQASTNARSYRLYVSTLKSDLYYRNLVAGRASAARRTYSSTRPRLTAGSLTYRVVPYYYRLEAVNGTQHSYSDNIRSIGLRPYVPTDLTASSSAYLRWRSGRATGFSIKRATDSAMTGNVQVRAIRGEAHQYTPYGLAKGRTYYFRVRAINQGTPSAYSSAVSMTVRTSEQPVRAMTFNILHLSADGTSEPGGVIAPWSQRRPAAATLIKSVDPDVIGVQEANDWVGSEPGTRQVDSLNSALRAIGATYNVAATEIRYPNSGWHRYGNYILYKPSVYQAYAAGGHWDIGDNRWAAYQPLQRLSTGARFLFVSTHLIAGRGYNIDLQRQYQTERLLEQATAKAAALGVPVIYAGDFNSNPLTKQHPLDGPGVVIRAAHINDARLIAQSHHYERYDSMNEYLRTPMRYFIYIDYLFAPPGVATSSWGTALRLSGGKWVGTIPSDHDPVYATMIVRY